MNLDKQERLAEYQIFCEKNSVPIFSQPWWMDAVCKPENWDVWLCHHGDDIVAAMPYYIEIRNGLRYITKAPLTQNNGIIFSHKDNSTPLSRQKAEEKIVNEVNTFIESMDLDVYEQQYRYTFDNWSPFYWHGYDAMPRYTYVIEDTSDLEKVESEISRGHRKSIRKGSRNGSLKSDLNPEIFYKEHEKIFLKQDLMCPFSYDLWIRLYEGIRKNNAGKIIYAETATGDIASLMLLVWDKFSAYPLLGGSMPEFQSLDTYSMLTWESIKITSEMGLSYDFEGSMIERIAKSFREYGGTPKQYFRIRKVFNPDIIRKEAEDKIRKLCPEV